MHWLGAAEIGHNLRLIFVLLMAFIYFLVDHLFCRLHHVHKILVYNQINGSNGATNNAHVMRIKRNTLK